MRDSFDLKELILKPCYLCDAPVPAIPEGVDIVLCRWCRPEVEPAEPFELESCCRGSLLRLDPVVRDFRALVDLWIKEHRDSEEEVAKAILAGLPDVKQCFNCGAAMSALLIHCSMCGGMNPARAKPLA